ncbi:MAG: Flp pilus assembly protein CpaB [Alphaproteobacteria bacterium]|nr:Flp pilus assembly protein CpaB [Alphaproteobacteria bacterium]
MNRSRVIVLAVAAIAAGLAALLVRGLLGGGTETTQAAIQPQKIPTEEVLVAAQALPAGTKLSLGSVTWQEWPQSAVDSTFITRHNTPSLDKLVQDTVVRAPMVQGEPFSQTKIVRADGGGYMAAMLTPGMRAVSIGINTATGAGGFILPNDRVDVLVTEQVSDSPRIFRTRTILNAVRVLAVDQTFTPGSDQKVVSDAKTATLELSSGQAEAVQRAQASGTLSLTLRALGDSQSNDVAQNLKDKAASGDVAVIRYGVMPGGPGRGE